MFDESGVHGEHREPSGGAEIVPSALVAPVKGVMYADTGGWRGYTTGLGMHAAAGARELHNFCAAVGPDFRHHFVDQYPSGNLDLRATIARAMGLPSGDKAASAGRAARGSPGRGHQLQNHDERQASTIAARVTVSRTLPTTVATTISTTLDFSVLSAGTRRWSYLDGAEYQEDRQVDDAYEIEVTA